jgi:ATP-dependent exoDNAse (exonuclease V) alpha subunit
MKQGTTDRFMFDTSKANTLPKLPTQTGEKVYHGTNYDKFDPTKAVSRDGQYGKGIYFASDKAVAKQYGKNTIEAVLDKDSLLKMDKPLTPQQQANLRKVMGRDEWDWSKNPTGDFVWGRLELSHKNPEEILKKAGIKGVEHSQYTTKGTNKNYVIFDDSAVSPSLPTQVEGLAKEVQLSDKPYNFKYTSDEMPTTGKTITYQGKEVGGIGYGKDLNQKDAWLHNIEIDPQYRNKGIGKKAIDQFFQTSGANKVNGYAESPEAAKFFKSLGAKVDTDGNFTLSKTDFFNQSKGVQNAVQAVRAVKK